MKGINRYYLQSLAVLALILTTAFWGSTFFLIKDLLTNMTTLSFLGVRFIIAGTLSALIFSPRLMRANRKVWQHAFSLGAVYSTAQILQTKGLETADASVVGFITGLYVVITPLLVWLLFKEKIKPVNLVAALVAMAGLMVLSLKGISLGIGELLSLLGAVLFALHIVLTARWAAQDDPITLAAIQLIAIGVFCFLTALPYGIELPQNAKQWSALLYTVIFAAIGALIMQTWAQRHLRPTKAAVIMTVEPVFAAVFAVLFGGEDVTLRLVIGGTLVVSAMLATELIPAYRARDKIRTAKE
ncbi:DMT family transporter [Varibaculum vaginae]|uniref:DMT family transporter n=1 Tax=Varibaculum vaginae TaxID=2364797 RepID=UPI001F1B87AF|nr:DMT family transporter [Varibaculum vaginae]